MILPKCHPSSVIIFTSVSELPVSWDNILPSEHPLQSKVLAIYESLNLPDITTYYALFGSKEQPLAVAYFQLLKIQSKHLSNDLLTGFQSALVMPFLTLLKPRLLIAGHLFRHDIVTFYAAPSLGNLEIFRAYEKMISAVSNKASALAILVKDVPANLVPYFQNFAPQYTLLRNDISMQMELKESWKTFGDYESSLKHKYAQKLRKVRSSLQQLSIKELPTEEVVLQSANIFHLYEQVRKNQTFSMGLLNEAFLPELKKFYGEELKVWAFYEGDTIVAFASAWVHKDSLDMFYIGLDYKKNATLNLYFNILYLSIEQAIFFKKPLLIMGRTALEAKARLGCNPHYLHTFLMVRYSYLRRLVSGKLNSQHQKEGEWEERHPFKGA